MPSDGVVPLPRGWAHHVKSGLLHAISLAAMCIGVVSENSNDVSDNHLPNA
jgi:hypothetical protein